MSNITLSITAESTQELQGLLKELAEGGITAGSQTVAIAKPVEKVAEPKSETVAKTAVDDESPEIATRNRWIELTDGSMVAVKKGEELPPAEDRAKNVKKEEFEAWEQAQISGDGVADSFGDDSTDDFSDDDDDFVDDDSEDSNDGVIDFETFKGIVKLVGAERGKALMKKHSKTGSATIAQYETDAKGRAAIDAELQEKWSNYDKAIAKVTGA